MNPERLPRRHREAAGPLLPLCERGRRVGPVLCRNEHPLQGDHHDARPVRPQGEV